MQTKVIELTDTISEIESVKGSKIRFRFRTSNSQVSLSGIWLGSELDSSTRKPNYTNCSVFSAQLPRAFPFEQEAFDIWGVRLERLGFPCDARGRVKLVFVAPWLTT